MSEAFTIPRDMINEEMSEKTGGTVVSIRDMLVLLGMSDEKLAERDRVSELQEKILAAEPWRDKTRFVEHGRSPNGMVWGITEGEIDWTGTEMQAIHEKNVAELKNRFTKFTDE